MKSYLLDTCTISDFLRGDRPTQKKLQSVSPNQIALSSITIMEVKYGCALNPSMEKKFQPYFAKLISLTRTIPFDDLSAQLAAKLRAELKQKGTPIGAWDLLIASTALAHNLVLVTSNLREFSNVTLLELENWRLP